MDTRAVTLLYDEDCGICSALTRVIRALDWRHRISIRPIQASRDLLRGIPEERHLDAFHVLSPDGDVSTGGQAVPALLGALPVFSGLARLLRGSSPLMDGVGRLYAFLARFRDALICRVDFASAAAPTANRQSERGGP